MQPHNSKAPRRRNDQTTAAATAPARDAAATWSAGHSAKAGNASAAAKRHAESQKTTQPTASGVEKDAVLTPAALVYLSEEHTRQLREAFDMFDSDGTGRIKANEVKVAFYALGYAVNSVELERALRAAGVSTVLGPNGEEPTMDFSDFYNVLLGRMTDRESRSESVRAFMQIDQDDKGFISLEDLREIAESIHMELTDDELIEMMLFAQSTTPNAASGGGVSGNVAAEFGAKESFAVTEEQFLKLLKRANLF